MKKKLRRGAILVMVLVLLFSNTMGAKADTGEPTVIVSDYGSLYTAISEAQSGDEIGIRGTITIPAIVNLNPNGKTIILRRMEADAKIVISGDYGDKAIIKDIFFNGNGFGENPVGGTTSFVEVNGNVEFSYCYFIECFNECLNESDSGGAVNIISGDARFYHCSFYDNCGYYGGSIYNAGNLTLEDCVLRDNWAEEKGGAIYNTGILILRDTEIRANYARVGGGLFSNASAELYNTISWNNTVDIHGTDIACEGSFSDYTTEAEYNSWLDDYSLFYNGWLDDLDTSVGGAGVYKKLLTTDTDPTVTPIPDPDDGGNEGGSTDEETGGTTEDDPVVTPTPTPDSREDAGGESSGEDNSTPDAGDTDNSTTDNSTTDSSTTDNSVTDNSTMDNSDHSTTDNSQTTTDNSVTDSSTTDNSIVDSSVTDNSTTDSSVTDSSTTDNSNNSITDNSQSSSTTDNSVTDSSQHSSTTDNSSIVSNTDNSSSKSESSSTENSNNTTTTTYNYYQTEKEGEITPQSSTQPITVNVTVPQPKEPEKGTQELTEASQSVAQNISIDAEGVNVKYEYTAEGVSISISPYTAPESLKEAEIIPTVIPTVATPQEPEESPINWVDYVIMILLGVLVLGELADKFKLKSRG